MSDLLLTFQLVCYGVGFVSASLNIASFVRGWLGSDVPTHLKMPVDEPNWRTEHA
jgi:hypothetical protein